MKPHNTQRLSAAVTSVPFSPFKRSSITKLHSLPIVLALSVLPVLPFVAFAQPESARAISFPVSIQWAKQKGVAKYRVQIASDENFRSIFFDGRVNGERYTVAGLPPGYYYWRTAPSDFSTGQFSKPVRFFISGGEVVPVTASSKAVRQKRARAISKRHQR